MSLLAAGTVVEVTHPLVRHKLGLLRDESTPTQLFRQLVDELTLLLTYEATKDMATEEVVVRTPLEETTVERISGKKVAVCPILRAGIGMLDGVLSLISGARVGFIGLYRDESTLHPVEYYAKLPDPKGRTFIVVDPMLATGGSAVAAVRLLQEREARDVRFMCLVAAPEGVQAMLARHPDVAVYTAALDRELDENGYIRPGLGDAGDRLFGTR